MVLVDLEPVKGSETGKRRPAVVVTNDIYNARVPVVQVVPLTAWSEKKGRILTNVVVEANPENGLAKKSVADCLQTRPVDRRIRVVGVRGQIDSLVLARIDRALALVFGLDTSQTHRL
ncbi:MAG: type II toxin-antitoxin system PemK/MazF family toxin [Vulcanimicrobiota bacterium]